MDLFPRNAWSDETRAAWELVLARVLDIMAAGLLGHPRPTVAKEPSRKALTSGDPERSRRNPGRLSRSSTKKIGPGPGRTGRGAEMRTKQVGNPLRMQALLIWYISYSAMYPFLTCWCGSFLSLPRLQTICLRSGHPLWQTVNSRRRSGCCQWRTVSADRQPTLILLRQAPVDEENGGGVVVFLRWVAGPFLCLGRSFVTGASKV